MSRDFRRVLAAEGISNFGAMLSRLAIPWLAALVLDATPMQMAALLVADVAAGAVGSLWLGTWVERHGKRAVMLASDGLRALVLASLALLAWQGAATMTALVLAAAANGVLTMAFEVARSAWMAQRLAQGELVERNAQLSVASSLSETAAFALGGWVFQWLGAAVALGADALSYIASGLCLKGVREAAVAPTAAAAATATTATTEAVAVALAASTPATGFVAAVRQQWREVAAGLGVIAGTPTLRALAIIEALLALAMSLGGTSYMIYVARDLGIPTGQLGLIAAMGGLGAIAGAHVAAAAGRRWGAGRAMAAGLFAAALGSACIPLATGAGAFAVALLVAHQIVGDAGHTLHQVHDRTLRQTQVPAEMLARADAGIRGVGQLAMLAGALFAGAFGTFAGARGALVLGALVTAAAAIYAAWRLRHLRGVQAAQAAPAARV